MKVLALAFPGFTFIDLAGPMQAFMMLPGFSSQIVWHSKGIVDSDAGVSDRDFNIIARPCTPLTGNI